MLAFKTKQIHIKFADDSTALVDSFFFKDGSTDEDKSNIAYFQRQLGIEKKLYNYNNMTGAGNLSYMKKRVELIKQKFNELTIFGLKIMMGLLYTESDIVTNDGSTSGKSIACTYVTLEDAYDQARECVESLIPTYDFMVSLSFPSATTAVMSQIESQDFKRVVAKTFASGKKI